MKYYLPKLEELIVNHRSMLRDALVSIDKAAQGVCFIVDDSNILIGVLTDGDIRRALIKGTALEENVCQIMTKDFVSLHFRSSIEEVQGAFTDRIKHIPLIDDLGRPVDYSNLSRIKHLPVMEPVLEGNELSYITQCVRTSWISSRGKFVEEFENAVAQYCNMPYATSVSSGTVGIQLALAAFGVGPGDEVIIPDLTFAATANAVIHSGATPVLVDVDRSTWNLDLKKTISALTDRTKAIMPVHLYGYPFDVENLRAHLNGRRVLIIEDAAEAFGSQLKQTMVGSLGDAAIFSFFGNKTITTGEGGMVLFREEKAFENALILKNHGMSKERRYWHNIVGFNFRMTNLQAAIGVAQMERIASIIERKLKIASIYRDALKEIDCIELPPSCSESVNTHWLFTILLDEKQKRDGLARELMINGIETRPIFCPLHEMPPYKNFAKEACFPNSRAISRAGLSLPSAINLTPEDIKGIVDEIKKGLENQKLLSTARIN